MKNDSLLNKLRVLVNEFWSLTVILDQHLNILHIELLSLVQCFSQFSDKSTQLISEQFRKLASFQFGTIEYLADNLVCCKCVPEKQNY